MSGLTRVGFKELWARLNSEAERIKLPEQSLAQLIGFYRGLDEEDRRVVDDVLTSWVLEGDPSQRFDALAIIEDFDIQSALPALRADLARLKRKKGPLVPDDIEQLEQIIAHLE
jgi:hypothetical protein